MVALYGPEVMSGSGSSTRIPAPVSELAEPGAVLGPITLNPYWQTRPGAIVRDTENVLLAVKGTVVCPIQPYDVVNSLMKAMVSQPRAGPVTAGMLFETTE